MRVLVDVELQPHLLLRRAIWHLPAQVISDGKVGKTCHPASLLG